MKFTKSFKHSIKSQCKIEQNLEIYIQEASEEEIESCQCVKILIADVEPFNTMALEGILNTLQLKADFVFDGK